MASGHTIRVMCVDDSPDLRESLEVMLSVEPDMDCIASLPSADDLVETALARKPDVVLLDLTMPGKEPCSAMRELAARAPGVRILAFSGFDDDERIKAVLDAGGWGLVSKHASMPEVITAIRRVARGDAVLRGA